MYFSTNEDFFFPRRWVTCTVSSQHSVFKMSWVWIALQPPSVFHGLGFLRVKESIDRFGSCWHKEQGALCSSRRVLTPGAPQGQPHGQQSEEQSCGYLSPSVQPPFLVQVWELPRGENSIEGLLVTSGGQVWRRHHPGIPEWNLLQISETSAHSSYCCFIYHLNVCHLLSFSVASYLFCAWSHAEVHYLEKLN